MNTLPVPCYTIGAIGHRPNRLTAPDAVAADIGRLLDLAVAASGNCAVMLVSSLAEGADRIAVHQALARGLLLKAVIPFACDDYAQDFPQSVAEFRMLLQAATQVMELPGSRDDAPAAYEAAARQVASDAAIMLAVWDGGPSGGRGGTTETIKWVRQRHRPLVWVDATGQKPPVTIPPGGELASMFAGAAPRY